MEENVFIALLRRPKKDSDEARSDPFWEFGSFGLTGCHARNLLNPKKAERLKNCRIAFVQGGPKGFKLLLITPPVNYKLVDGKCEITWSPHNLPFKYSSAPALVKNNSQSNFSYIIDLIKNYSRTTDEGKFASAFRSRTTPLESEVAKKLARDFDTLYRKVKPGDLISSYVEALPWFPPKPDTNRKKRYAELKKTNGGTCRK